MRDEITIFMVGFMGSGKTEAGRALALLLGRTFLDLDSLIEERESRSIREIFTMSGEREFRRLETEAIKSLSGLTRSVVALGGGAFQSQENRHLLSKAGVTVFLDCPFEMCFARIKGDLSRPLLAGEAETRRLFEQRRATYHAADYVVETVDLSPGEIAIRVAEAFSA